jgi:hypothetical protein
MSEDARAVCPLCRGTGIVTLCTECLNFEDQRFCLDCEAGRKLALRIDELIAKVSAEEHIPAGKNYTSYKASS